MTISEWVEFEKQRLEKFKDFWMEGSKRGPSENWPEHMVPEEWAEQYYSFKTQEG